jgi:signal transduction histidine kinase
MSDLINDVLDTAKFEAGKVSLECLPVKIVDMLNMLILPIRENLKTKQIGFRTEISEDIPEMLEMDPTRIKQILSNLLSNAVKFTPKNGEIGLVARCEPFFPGQRPYVKAERQRAVMMKQRDAEGMGMGRQHHREGSGNTIHENDLESGIVGEKYSGKPRRDVEEQIVVVEALEEEVYEVEEEEEEDADYDYDEEEPELYWLILEISDSGIGISPEVASNLFKPYEQANISTSREYGGTGLGLAICKQIIDLMEGSIRVESQVGKGTRFIVKVPVLAVYDREQEEDEEDGYFGEEGDDKKQDGGAGVRRSGSGGSDSGSTLKDREGGGGGGGVGFFRTGSRRQRMASGEGNRKTSDESSGSKSSRRQYQSQQSHPTGQSIRLGYEVPTLSVESVDDDNGGEKGKGKGSDGGDVDNIVAITIDDEHVGNAPAAQDFRVHGNLSQTSHLASGNTVSAMMLSPYGTSSSTSGNLSPTLAPNAQTGDANEGLVSSSASSSRTAVRGFSSTSQNSAIETSSQLSEQQQQQQQQQEHNPPSANALIPAHILSSASVLTATFNHSLSSHPSASSSTPLTQQQSSSLTEPPSSTSSLSSSQPTNTSTMSKPPPSASTSTSPAPPPPNEDFSQLRILVVDDSAINRKILSKLLKILGVQTIDECINGQECLDLVLTPETQPYDMIFMDIQMPVLDGIEATKKLRERHVQSAIVAVTGNHISDKEGFLKHGFTTLAPKPFLKPDALRMLKEYKMGKMG